ncbi:MAG: aldo/keto reductase [Anaerolineales bacterium]|nr:aldo/keto reductase [Anaerolineales bacterium]
MAETENMADMEYAVVQGVKVPKMGLGTYKMRGSGCQKAVEAALDMGYRHIDTAEIYRNEREIGQAIGASPVDREELFLVSKVWSNHFREDQVVQACEDSLRRLGTDYLDLYLIHWPSDEVPVEETLAGMDRLAEAGKTRHIGVSNFPVDQLEEARRIAEHPIFCDQVKYHVRHRQDDLVSYCQGEDVLLTAYSPLEKARLQGQSTLGKIGSKYGKTEMQVALRWLIEQEKVVTIPKASSESHQRENLEIFDFELTEEDREAIDSIG